MEKRICFVGSDNYPVLNPSYGSVYIGGESVQQTLLCRAFAARGYSVCMSVKDLGQPDGEEIGGVRVWKTFRQEAGLPVIRFVHPRITGLWGALKRADADIYYQSCAGVATGVVAKFCRIYGKNFVFRVAHDTDCIPGAQLIPYWRDRKIFEYGLRHADLVISQSEQQRELLKLHYRIDSPTINMVVEQPEEVDQDRDIDILWVNNFRPFKRPELVPELAQILPDCRFVMIGGPCHGHEDLYADVERAAASANNLEFKGFVPYQNVNAYYRRAKIFVNTSDSEGFPNSFLQAWIRGAPVVSYFDPDNIIEREGLGCSPQGLQDMAEKISALIGNEESLDALSAHVADYARENYTADVICDRYQALFGSAGI